MKEKIAFVAVGQAGGNIGQLLEQKGYSVLYVNTSREDLDTLEEAKHKYHIPGGEGCNKDRHKAKQLIIEDFDQIAAQIESTIKAELIYVVFASGGGTGSGAGPMLADLLIDEGRSVGIITILPDPKESVRSHMNAYECFTELTAIEGLASCFILDNEKGDKLQLNLSFVSDFTSFLEIPSTQRSVKGNIDRAEIIETLRAHGMAQVITSQASEDAGLIRDIRENCQAAMEADKVVKYIAASFTGEGCMEELEKAIGVPVDNFHTFNDRQTICCISGLSYPQDRLSVIYAKVDENREVIRKNLTATREILPKKDIYFLEGLEAPKNNENAPKKLQSKRDIMGKYL